MNAIESAIECLGGAGRLAAVLHVGQSAISNWRSRGTTPDALQCVTIERATKGAVTRQMLRPDDWADIWPELAEKQEAVR